MKISSVKKWFIRFFKCFSLTAVAFAFQACYGGPRDFGLDQYVEGIVLNANGDPVQNITVYIDDSIQYTQSDVDGKFNFYIPKRDVYKIMFSDNRDNDIFESKDTVIEALPQYSDISITMVLDKK